MTNWRKYERFVAKLIAEQSESDVTVISNAHIVGNITGAKRQIDVLLDYRYSDKIEKRVIVDAKRHKRRIDVKQIESFKGMMEDVRASKGIVVCPNGYTQAAHKRAQDTISIRLVPLSELENFDPMSWDLCSNPKCKSGFVLWDPTQTINVNDKERNIFAISKCDECSTFNIWCWGCGQRFALSDEDEWHCNCKGPWFWLTVIEDSSESEAEQLNAVYLLFVLTGGTHQVIDRKPLR